RGTADRPGAHHGLLARRRIRRDRRVRDLGVPARHELRAAHQGSIGVPPVSSEQAGVLRSSALMAAGTVTSRATGLIRDMALVAAIGFGTLADTYSLGNSLPNI